MSLAEVSLVISGASILITVWSFLRTRRTIKLLEDSTEKLESRYPSEETR